MKSLFLLSLFLPFVVSCSPWITNVPSQGAKTYENDFLLLNALYEKWLGDLESVVEKSTVGMQFFEGSKESELVSLRQFIHAPVDDRTWACFVVNKLKLEANNPTPIGSGGHRYLARGACARFNWHARDMLQEASNFNVDEWPLDLDLLRDLVEVKLQSVAVGVGNQANPISE